MSRVGVAAAVAGADGLALAVVQPSYIIAFAEVAVVGIALGWWLGNEKRA